MNAGFASRALLRPLRPLRPLHQQPAPRCFSQQASALGLVAARGRRRTACTKLTNRWTTTAGTATSRRMLSTRAESVSGRGGTAEPAILMDIHPEAKTPVQTAAGCSSMAAATPPPPPPLPLSTEPLPSVKDQTATAADATAADATIPPDHQLPAPHAPSSDPIPVVNTVPTLPLWQRLGPLTWAADSYGRAQRRRPYVVQLCSALVIALLADLSVQRMNGDWGADRFNPLRTVRSLVIGGVAAIPGFLWFVFLARHFNYASSRVLSIVVKVAVNQALYTPVFNTYFFGMQALLAGESPQAAWERVRRTVPVSLVSSLKVWPAVTAVNFAFVPLEYRSLVAGVVAVGWQTYLVYLNRNAENAQGAKAAVGEVVLDRAA